MDMIAEIIGGMAGILLLILLFNGIAILGSIALYVLQALGLYQIAQRRAIRHSWMSWVPVLNTWILGSLSDQYNYVVHRKFRCARKWLLGLDIGICVTYLVTMILGLVGMFGMLTQMTQITSPEELMKLAVAQPMYLASLVGSIVYWVVAIAGIVVNFVCLHNLYASCQPKNKTVYTVFSILFPVTIPIFVFVCRNKDLGMPPRRESVPEAL